VVEGWGSREGCMPMIPEKASCDGDA